MTREQLAQILRAASRIAGDSTIFVVGSQSILGSYDDAELPDEAIGSVEVDLYFAPDPGEEKTTKVDLHIGEETHFHEAFSIYAQGVAEETSDLPAGWEERRVSWTSPQCDGAVAICLEPHDLAAAKLVAGREKDREFVTALLDAGLLDVMTLHERIDALNVPLLQRNRMHRWLDSRRAHSE